MNAKKNLLCVLAKIAKMKRTKSIDLPTRLLNESFRDREFGYMMMQFALEYLRPLLPKDFEENKSKKEK